MPDIRYVCLSDTHFGAATSVLTNLKVDSNEVDGLKPAPVLVELVACLRYLIEQNADQTKKPTLVLNGDILELALADDHDAAMTFERFIDLIMDEHRGKMFDQIFFIPGNHDHHLWETARESQYVDYISSDNPAKAPWGSPLKSPWHTTRMFSDPTRAYFLTALIRRRNNLQTMTIETAYPNFGLLSEDRRRCVAFHHGHFVESIYSLMSTLKTMLFPGSRVPIEIWNLEAENFAWIDFFWSTLGRSSAVGQGVSRIYEKLQNPDKFKELLNNLAAGLVQRYGSSWAGGIETKVLDLIFNSIYNRLNFLERNQPREVLSKDATNGLSDYIHYYLPVQMYDEKIKSEDLEQLTFIFGHTHKPLQETMSFPGFSDLTKVYNSGGWVVDSVERQEFHGGAVILIDENLEATSLRMYNESQDPTIYEVTVQEASQPGDPPSALHQRIVDLVAGKPDLWKSFSQAAYQTVSDRAEKLNERINSPD
jgi:Calcineurin-like phosphoesterase